MKILNFKPPVRPTQILPTVFIIRPTTAKPSELGLKLPKDHLRICLSWWNRVRNQVEIIVWKIKNETSKTNTNP